MKLMILFACVGLSVIPPLAAQTEPWRYLSQVPPDEKPKRFDLQTHDGYSASDRIAVSSNGKEVYYTEMRGEWETYRIRCYRYVSKAWIGPFDVFENALGPALSPDNQTIFFEEYNSNKTSWKATREGDGWGKPAPSQEWSDPSDKHYVQETSLKRLYASSSGAAGGSGQMDIGINDGQKGRFVLASLKASINSPGNEGDFYIARDESFFVFSTPHRGGFGGADLFLSLKQINDAWSEPVNLGAPVNTSGFEYGPYVTDDGRYLFYSSWSGSGGAHINWIHFDTILARHRKPGRPDPAPKVNYFGNESPDDSPVIFAPDVVSLPGRFNQNGSFSPDGREFCFTVTDGGWNSCDVWYAKFENGSWSAPVVAPFNAAGDSWDPCFTPDGKHLLYCHAGDIWLLEKTPQGWSRPWRPGAPVNSGVPEFSPSAAVDGTLYFFSRRDLKIHRAQKNDDQTYREERVKSPINDFDDREPFIAPDESYLIFTSTNRPGCLGESDLYIRFMTERGWTIPVGLGPKINSMELEFSPKITPDGKYFLFSRRERWQTSRPSTIMWVKANFIESLEKNGAK